MDPNRLSSERKNALYMQRGQPPEDHYGQALPELSNVAPIQNWLKRHPNAAGYLPSAETLRGVYDGLPSMGSSPVEAAPGGVSVVPKSRPGPSLPAMHQKGRAGAIRGALSLPPDLGEEETILHDYADSAEGRAIAEALLREPGNPEAVSAARVGLLTMVRR